VQFRFPYGCTISCRRILSVSSCSESRNSRTRRPTGREPSWLHCIFRCARSFPSRPLPRRPEVALSTAAAIRSPGFRIHQLHLNANLFQDDGAVHAVSLPSPGHSAEPPCLRDQSPRVAARSRKTKGLVCRRPERRRKPPRPKHARSILRPPPRPLSGIKGRHLRRWKHTSCTGSDDNRDVSVQAFHLVGDSHTVRAVTAQLLIWL
jgi:hypothetical protein